MSAYAWYYNDHENDIHYWCYSSDMRTTDFASKVSLETGKRITASYTSQADSAKELEKQQRGMTVVRIW